MVNDGFPYQMPERRGEESGDRGPGITFLACEGEGLGEKSLRRFLPVPISE